MILAAHQATLIPWLPYFRKMQLCDKFVMMIHCQFEKNSYLNRFKYKEKWITSPVNGGNDLILNKSYVTGKSLWKTNGKLIIGFADLIGIDTSKVVMDFPTEKTGTERIIELCKKYECDEYMTNPEAEEKYLDVELINKEGIKIIPFIPSNDYKISLFEAFEKWGIEWTRKMICKI